MSIARRLAGFAALALTCASPALGFDLQSTTVPGRDVPALSNGEIAINRADKRLMFRNVDGTLGYGSLLNALPSGRKAVEQGRADDLFMLPDQTAPDNSLARIAASIANRFAETISAADRGVVCDGGTDIGPKMQTIANLWPTETKAYTVALPAGRCLWNTSATFPYAVKIRGRGINANGSAQGTVLVQTNPGVTPLTFLSPTPGQPITNGAGLENVVIQQMQPAPASGWAPTDYAPFLSVPGVPDFQIRDVMLYGVTRFMRADGSGRLTVDNVRGQCFKYCFQLDNQLDSDRISRVHYYNFWSSDPSVLAYTQANASLFVIGRQDTPFYSQIFGLGLQDLFRFANVAGNGPATKVSISDAHGDLTKYCLHVTGITGVVAQVGSMSCQHQAVNTASAPAPVAGGRDILVDAAGSAVMQIGSMISEYADGKVLDFQSTTVGSILQANSVVARLIQGGAANALIGSATVPSGSPHIVDIATPPILAPIGGPLPIATGSNAVVNVAGGANYNLVQGDLSGFQGGTFGIFASIPSLIISPLQAGQINNPTFVLPSAAREGETVTVMTTQNAAGVIWQSTSGIVNAPSTMTASQEVVFRAMGGAWFRVR